MDMTADLVQHYEALSGFIDRNKDHAIKLMGKQFTAQVSNWLLTYAAELNSGNLGWGVFLFQKSNV